VNDSGIKDGGASAYLGYRLSPQHGVFAKVETYRADTAGFGYVDPHAYNPDTTLIQILYPQQEFNKYLVGYDPAEAKRLLAEAGVPTPVKVSLIVINDPDARRTGEALKSMAAEGGFDVLLEPTEFASSLDLTDAGKYQMFRIGWSGQVDADGNVSAFVQTGGSRNISGYTDPQMDAWLTEARGSQDLARRKELYGKVITKIQQDVPLIYLYRTKNLVGVNNKVGGVLLYSDAVMRLQHAGFVE